jgi:hypothetical protein
MTSWAACCIRLWPPRELVGGKGRVVSCCFAIIPDGGEVPVAVFESLEDAMEWGVHKYGGGRFTIRHVPVTQAASYPAKKAAAS